MSVTHIRIRTLVLCSLLCGHFLFAACQSAETKDTVPEKEEQVPPKNEVSLLFVGDVMQHGGQISAALNTQTGGYDYDNGFQFVRPYIDKHDISIANLEVTHAGKPYAGYPQFSAPDELSGALKTAGFDVLLTCNNHSCDGGAKGVVRTLDVLDKQGILHTGTFRNKEERDKTYPLMLEKNGMKIALLNYTYGTNGIKVPPPVIINYIDSNVIRKDIEKAKKQKADYIICTMHWGSEYQSIQGDYQEKWEKYCYSLGVDMIIGSHPHVIQPVERKTVQGKERVTVWSLGNYVSNQRDRYKNGGLTVSATLKRQNEAQGSVGIKDVSYLFHYVHVKQEKKGKWFYILPEFNYLTHRPDFLTETENAAMKQFFSDSRSLFAKNNVGSWKEDLISDTSDIGKQYVSLLKGYYTLLLDTVSLPSVPKYFTQRSRTDLYRLPYGDGYAYTCGVFPSQSEANKQMAEYKKENELTGSLWRMLFVAPDEIKVVKE
jgi:hypothetical protein